MSKRRFEDFRVKVDFLLDIGRKDKSPIEGYRDQIVPIPKDFPQFTLLKELCAALTLRLGREISPSKMSNYRSPSNFPPEGVVHATARLYGFGGPADIDEAYAWWDQHWPSWWTSKPFEDVPEGHKRRDSAALFAEAYLAALKEGRLSFPAKPAPPKAAPSIEEAEAAVPLSPEMRRELELKTAIEALRGSRSIAEARRRKDSAFQLFDRFERTLGLMENVLASDVTDRVERLFRLYAPLEDDIGKIEAEGLAGCFDTLHGVKAGLDAINPMKPSSATRPGIQNDLMRGEELPHWQARQELLGELDAVERRLHEAMPILSREEKQRLSFDLEELRIILDRDPLPPEELSSVRDRLDAFNAKLDLLLRLRIATQLFMGVYAELLPPGAVFQDDERAPEMVVIRPGAFTMGSPPDEEGRDDDEGPQHKVGISRRFALGRYPVTVEEYYRFTDGSARAPAQDVKGNRGRYPVINVSWEDAEAYVAWLSELTGKGYRLPSEAEWEYACRAGTTTLYSFGNEITPEQANYDYSNDGTTEVGRYPENPWGLHDMHGNVWEWCEDYWNDNYEGAPVDGSAWLEGGDENKRVLRGGSWVYDPRNLRSANRSRDNTGDRDDDNGFRVARTLTP